MLKNNDKLIRYTGYYKSPDGIENFKIRIRLTEAIEANEIDEEDGEKWHVKEFAWQEKCFNKMEIQYFSDIANCATDLEKRYHQQITHGECTNDSIFFTCVDGDYNGVTDTPVNESRTILEKLMEDFHLTEECDTKYTEYDLEKSLTNAVQNKIIPNNVEKMFIIADLGEYSEETWIKNEIVLCAIRYDRISKTVSVFPDFTTTKPYTLTIFGQKLRRIRYFLEHASADIPDTEAFKENEIFRKVSEKKISLTREIIGDSFFLPPKNRLYVYLFFDILASKGFEYKDLFLQYFIDLPEHWYCDNPANLAGVTSICHRKNEENIAFYGHNFDVTLEYDIQSLETTSVPKSPCIYFQVVSKSPWNLYRTEGMTYQFLPVSTPGCHRFNSNCFRFDYSNCFGKLRRYFIGDAYNYKDVRWIGLPADLCDTGTFNKFGVNTMGTGEIEFRVNVVHQSQAFMREFRDGDVQTKFVYEKLNSSNLIRSVNQVLMAFKKARRKMYEVKKHV
ncbi:unnamed protein product [Phyllotreta striolata]|uniref:Uncharacterized protein n=1 Tax=Phyllotreta striolata TaxID=444603 RepID=A0A9N9XHQ9_PHYSR|nr:unnamed protein product [Phyllotreta striolata]